MDKQCRFVLLINLLKSISFLVYNWTNDVVIDWLVNEVRLPQYADNFRRNQVDGRMIPR